MKILFIGQRADYRPGFFNQNQCIIAREQGLCAGFVKLGHQATILGFGEDFDGVRVLPAAEVHPREYDGIVLCSEYAHWSAAEWLSAEDTRDLRSHPNVLVWADFFLPAEDDCSYARTIISPTTHVRSIYQRRFPDKTTALVPFAVPDVPPTGYENPWGDDKRLRVVYVGFLAGPDERAQEPMREIGQINRLAEAKWADVWIAVYHNTKDGVCRGFSAEERTRFFHPAVRFLNEHPSAPPYDPNFPFGSVRYGQQFPFFAHAVAGICFGRDPFRRPIFTSKIYDYIACGAPVIVEDTVCNAGDVVNLDAGVIVPHGHSDELRRGLREIVRRYSGKDNDRIWAEARAYGTWVDRARTIVGLLQ